jgi:hypothetical protein
MSMQAPAPRVPHSKPGAGASETDAVCVWTTISIAFSSSGSSSGRTRRRPAQRSLREILRQLEQRLVELLLARDAGTAPRQRDLLLGDVRALDALQPRRAERLEKHVALAERLSAPAWSRITRESVCEDTANAIRDGRWP